MKSFPAQAAPCVRARRRNPAAVLLGAAGVLAAITLPAAAQYPTRPIRIIAAAASGGGVDTIARVVGQKLAETWGQPVVVENRAGGGGTLGSELVAKSPADGHTLLAISIGHAVVPSLYRTLSYDPARDLVPITILVSAPNILVVHPSVPARSVAELLALARARPGEIYYSSSGNGSPPHLAVEYLKLVTKTDMVHVPYKGTAPGITDLIAGRVSLTFASITSAMPHVQTGKLRVLAVAGSRRAASHPQIPTVAEAGVAGYDVDVWYAALAPVGTPRDVMTALNREMARALKAPDLQPRFTALGLEPVGNSLETAQAYVQSEITKWSKVVRAAGIKAD